MDAFPLHDGAQADSKYAILELLEDAIDVNLPNNIRQTPLHVAARADSINAMQVLIEHAADVNAMDLEGQTPFHVAAQADSTNAMQMLIEHAVDVNVKDWKDRTPLHIAAQVDSINAMQVLIEHAANVNAVDRGGQTPLHVAARADSSNAIQVLIEHAAKVNAVDREGQSPLHVAAQADSKNAIRTLIKCGAGINQKDVKGRTPFHFAAQADFSDAMQIFIENGVNFQAADYYGQTSFHAAIQAGSSNAMQIIIEHTADINQKDWKGRTLLHVAVQAGSSNAMQTLLGIGGNIQATDCNGRTPLHLAAQAESTAAIQILLAHGADINAIDHDGKTSLHFIVIGRSPSARGEFINASAQPKTIDEDEEKLFQDIFLLKLEDTIKLIQILVANGADINATDKKRRTPLHDVIKFHSDIAIKAIPNATDMKSRTPLHGAIKFHSNIVIRVIKKLFEMGADINATDIKGRTPLHRVVKFHPDIAIELIQKLSEIGADINATDKKGRTPLHDVIEFHSDIAIKAIPNATDTTSRTSLHGAIKFRSNIAIRLVQKLFEMGAEINASDAEGRRPLHDVFRFYSDPEMIALVRKLVESGANTNAADINGQTPLHEAVKAGTKEALEVAKYLFKNGADIRAVDNNGCTPLHETVKAGTKEALEVAKYLLKNGADIRAVDNNGCTPLHEAARARRNGLDFVKHLLEMGANTQAITKIGQSPFRLAAEARNDDILPILCDKPQDYVKSDGAISWQGLTTYLEHAEAISEILTISRLNSPGHCFIARSTFEILQAYYPHSGQNILNWIAMICKNSTESNVPDSTQEVVTKDVRCARIRGKLTSGQLTWEVTANSRTFASEIEAALSWMLSILQSPQQSEEGLFTFTPKSLDLGLPEITRFSPTENESYCWTDLFSYACVADLSSWQSSSHSGTDGIEIDFDILLELAAVDREVLSEDGPVFLGFDTALIPLTPPESRRWHFLVTDGRQITPARIKKAYRGVRFQGKLEPEYCTGNVYVGWCASPVITIGTIDSDVVTVDDVSMSSGVSRIKANEESVERTSAHDASFVPRIGFLGSSLGGSWVRKRERKYKQTTVVSKRIQKGNFEAVLDSARATPCILWDASVKKAWLIRAISALHFASLRYVKWKNYSFKSGHADGQSEAAIIHHAAESTDTEKEADIALRKSQKLLADKANGVSVNDNILFEDIVRDLWFGMSAGEDVCSSDTTGKKYKSDKSILGYDLNEAICGQRIYLRSLLAENSMTNWLPLVFEKDVQVIFCRNMGEIVRCSSSYDDCSTKQYPQGTLSCLLQDLRAFYGELWDSHLNHPINGARLPISCDYSLVCNSHESFREGHNLCSKHLYSIISTKPMRKRITKNDVQAKERSSEALLLCSALRTPTLLTFGS